jgi:hypothetical protein
MSRLLISSCAGGLSWWKLEGDPGDSSNGDAQGFGLPIPTSRFRDLERNGKERPQR